MHTFVIAEAGVNHNGDMALGYSVSNSATNPDIRYAGRLAGDPLGDGEPTMADLPFDEQVHQTMTNLKTTLESAGSSLACLLQVSVYLRRQDDATRFDTIYKTYFTDYFPARTRLQAGLSGRVD